MDEAEDVEVGDETCKALEQEVNRFIPILALDLEWSKSVGFKELLYVFESQKWIKLLSECAVEDVYPRAMGEFCENYGYAKGTITGSVNGVEFSFDDVYLAELFGVPNEGYDNYFKGKYSLKIGKIGKDEILTGLGGVKGVNKIDHNSLSPLGKLMFNVVRRTVFPRTQKRGEANLLDCAVIYCLLFNVQINFPSLMISHLDHTVPSGLKVGYGPLLTTIFKSFNVPIEGYGKVSLKKDQFIQNSTLNGLNLGVLDGCTEWYTEILKKEEENKKKEEEKSKVRKSRRLLPKPSPGDVPTINLEDEGVRVKEIEVLVPRETEKLEKMLKELAEKQLDIEGQVFMMRQALSSFVLATEKRHEELMASLYEFKVPEGTPPKKAADINDDGTQNEKSAVAPENVDEEILIPAVPLTQVPPKATLNP